MKTRLHEVLLEILTTKEEISLLENVDIKRKTDLAVSKSAITKVQATILAIIIMIAVIAGIVAYQLKLAPLTEKPVIRFASSSEGCDYIRIWKEEAEAELGIEIEVTAIPWEDLFNKLITDLMSGAGRYDVFIWMPNMLGELAENGWVVQLDQYIDEENPWWTDIFEISREKVPMWGGHYYCIPADLDMQMLAYRKDIIRDSTNRANFEAQYGYPLPEPPKTWDELRDICEFFDGWDWDGDGEIEYGWSSICRRRTLVQWTTPSYTAQWSVKPGPPSKYTGMLWFDPETMEPLCNTPGWIEGLRWYRDMLEFAPPGVLDYGEYENIMALMSGLVFACIDWADIGPWQFMPGSIAQNKVGFARLPGANRYWAIETGTWVEEFNQIDVITFGGGMSFFISYLAEDPELCFDFIEYYTQPERALYAVCAYTEVATGVQVYRHSSMFGSNPEDWEKYGWDEETGTNYCNVIWEVATNPNAVMDIRIPGGPRFLDLIDMATTNVISGYWTPEFAAEFLYNEEDGLIDELGRENLLEAFRRDVGLPPL